MIELARLPRVSARSAGAYALAATLAAACVGAGLRLAGVTTPITGVLTVVFLTVAPAAAVSGLVTGNRLARVAVAVAGSLVVNAAVAEAMLASRMWSPRGGLVAVAAISALCAAARPLTRTARPLTRTEGTQRGARRRRPPR